jgi:hypothetical protein
VDDSDGTLVVLATHTSSHRALADIVFRSGLRVWLAYRCGTETRCSMISISPMQIYFVVKQYADVRLVFSGVPMTDSHQVMNNSATSAFLWHRLQSGMAANVITTIYQ